MGYRFNYLGFAAGILRPFALVLFTNSLWASGRGPFFPTHRFPTDESYHFGLNLGYLSSNSNFISLATSELLPDLASMSVFRSSLSAEFQPNRRFSGGLQINLDTVRLKDLSESATFTKTGLSDHYIFSEYRFYDEPGSSAGFAFVVKFPTYKNPTLLDLGTPNPDSSAFLGDAQTDFTFLFTTEYWSSQIFRVRLDTGYTQRLEGFNSEIPLLFSFGFVTHKVDLDLRFRGNLSVPGSGLQDSLSDLEELRSAFKDSRYVLSQNPWGLQIQPALVLWLNPSTAFEFKYSYALLGNNSAKFHDFPAGITYRWAQKKSQRKRTFQQVDITTDQETGVFQGENQGRDLEPRFVDPNPIKDAPAVGGDEEFF